MEVCRVCLATNVKMYDISEHNLSVMFERVTGVEIKTEDKFPQMLCWECVARLSSANNFKVKALRTQWILLNKMSSNQFMTINDTESIDKDRNQLKSSLSLKFYKVNYFDLHVFENKDGNEEKIMVKEELTESNESCHIDNKYKAHWESVNIDFDEETKDAECIETSAEIDIDCNIESSQFDENLSVKYKIKSDPLSITEKVGMSSDKAAEDTRDISQGNGKRAKNTRNQESAVDSDNELVEAESEKVEVTKQFLNNNPIQQRHGNQSSNTQSRLNVPRLMLEDTDASNSNTLDSYEQFKDPTTKIKSKILFNNKNGFLEEQANTKDTIHPSSHTSDPGSQTKIKSDLDPTPGPSNPNKHQRIANNDIYLELPVTKREKRADMKSNEKMTVINVYKYIERCSSTYPIKADVLKKTAETIGVSVSTVKRILHEYKTTGKVSTPDRSKPKYDIVGKLDDATLSAIRRKVNEFTFSNDLPTVSKVLQAVNDDKDLPSFTRSTMYNILKRLNFKRKWT